MRISSVIGLVATLAVVGVRAAETSAVLWPVDGDGCYVAEDGAGLWASLRNNGQGEAAYREAEQADVLKLQDGKEVGRDTRCGGEAYVAFVTQVEFKLDVNAAGTYQGWARTFLPFPGSWAHHESMDGGRRQLVRDSTRQVFGRWFWSKLGQYQIQPGSHRFVLHGWLGGARLDAILFSNAPDFDPTGLAGRPASDGRPDVGRVVTALVTPSGVLQWQRLTLDADRTGGRLQADVSTDGGKTWVPCGDTGDLTALKPAGDGHDTLVARVTMHASPDGRSPIVRSARASYVLAPDAEATLANEHYAIAVSRRTGQLVGIVNRAADIAVTPLHLQRPVVGLVVRKPGATAETVVPPGAVRFEAIDESPRRLSMHYTALDGRVKIAVEMLGDATALSRWRCTVTNGSAMEIIRLDFPLLAGAAIGDYRDDECVIPRTGGWRIKTPARDKVWTTTYMGGGSMGWLDLCDERAGLYVAMHDKDLKTTILECAPAEGRRAADMAMRTHTAIAPGKMVTREYLVGVHRGDWHWAADRYREWAYSWMKHPQPPEWVKWCDGWTQATDRLKFGAMTTHLERAQQEGLDYLQYWGHMADGMDQCCGNFYWPAPALGGADGFRRGVADVQSRGGRVTAYMNCQTWTRDSYKNPSLRMTPKTALPQEALALIHPLEWFERWRLYPLDGKPMGYYASTLGWYIMCPASQGFQEHMRFWVVDMYCKRFGTDGVYIDQTGATAAKPCYNLSHGHGDVGDWGAGNVELLRMCIEQARAHNPDFMIAIEGAGDALGQYADLHLISGLCTAPEVYHYTFPDHILISGVSNSSHLSRKQRVSRAFLNGDRFDTALGSWEMQSAVRLRKRIKWWLYPGRFMDTVGLELTDDRVLACWSICDQPGNKAIVITVDNEHAVADATCTLALPDGWRRPEAITLFDREGDARAVTPAAVDDQLRLAIPASTLSAALVVYATAPEHSVDVWCAVRPGPAGQDTVALGAANHSPQPVEVSASLTTGPALRIGGEPMTLRLAAHGTVRRELSIAGLNRLNLAEIVTVESAWPTGRNRQSSLVRPMVTNGTLDVDVDGDGAPDAWRANGSKTDFARGMEDGGAWIQGHATESVFLIQLVRLMPEASYTFAGQIRRSAQTKGVSIAVVEHVGLRGIRAHHVGDDETLPADTWQRFETTFTTGKTFRVCAIYLYALSTDAKAWFRDIELRPATTTGSGG